MRLLTRDEIRSRAPRTGWWLGLAAVLLFGVLFLSVRQKTMLSGQLARIERKERLLSDVRTRQKSLLVEIQRLGYPGRLEAIASGQLGMRYPDRQQMVVMLTPPAAGDGGGAWASVLQPVRAAWSQP